MPALFNKVTLIGIGLIGSSIARVIKRDKIARHLVAVAKSKKTIDSVLKLGIADSVTLDLSEAVKDADMVMLCSPLGTYKKIVREIGPNLKRGCILTDVGSVKGCVFEDIEIEKLLGVNLVPAHPVAGTEYSGPEAGFVELFEGRWCVITPDKTASKESIEKIRGTQIHVRKLINLSFTLGTLGIHGRGGDARRQLARRQQPSLFRREIPPARERQWRREVRQRGDELV